MANNEKELAGHSNRGKPRPKLFRALGENEAPERIQVDGKDYVIEESFKHDSWAATAMYRSTDDSTRIVCKFNRKQSILGIPMAWLGRSLAERERYFLDQLSDVSAVPDVCGTVFVDGVAQPNAAAHLFVDGAPLQSGQETRLAFFRELKELLQQMHQRGFAYVDLHKPENVIVGDDGKPHLIDFQISFRPFKGWLGKMPPCKAFQRMLVLSDLYHLRKMRIQRHRNVISHEQYLKYVDRPWWIGFHRALAQPLRQLRRKMFVLLRIRRDDGYSKTEYEPEMAVRLCENTVDSGSKNATTAGAQKTRVPSRKAA